MNCTNCKTKLLKSARYCHQCGTEVVTNVKPCPHCDIKNPSNAKFCHACGQSMDTESAKKKTSKKKEKTKAAAEEERFVATYPIVFHADIDKITEQIKTHFFKALKSRVKEQSSESKYSEYLELFYNSGFNYFFDGRINQLTHIILPLKSVDSDRAAIKIDQLLDEGFEMLLDRFTIEHTKHLNEIQLSNAVLRYQFAKKEEVENDQMIFDYLDLQEEKTKRFIPIS